MNKADFTDLLKNPEKLGTEHIETLRKIVTDFPFFSTAHVLLAKALANTNHYEYEKQLKITALLTGDRAVLYQFITGNKDHEGDIEAFNVPLELKVEKVSKPDFEITEEEVREAELLNKANSLLEEAETTFNSEAEKETVEEAIEKISNVEVITSSDEEAAEEEIEDNNQLESRGGKVLDTDEETANENTDGVVNESELIQQEEPVVEEENINVSEEILNDTKVTEDFVVSENSEEVVHEFVEERQQEEESNESSEIVEEIDETHHDIIEPVESVEEREEVVAVSENNDNDVSSENEESSDSLVAVELNDNTKEKVFQLAETEGTLVRFRGNFSEEILQDFDETSFEDNKENIETVTQSVTPITPKEEQAFSLPTIEEEKNQNDLSETKLEEQDDTIVLDTAIAEEIAIEDEVEMEETAVITDNHIEETEEEETGEIIEQPVFVVEPAVPVSLDDLLEKYNDEQDEEPPFITDEIVVENKLDEDEEAETLVEEEVTEISETPNTEYNTGNEDGLNFIDWLNKNKAESNQNTENRVEAKTNKSVEDDELTSYIQHLIKAKAESTLAKNIEAETQFEKTEEETPIAENIISAIELPDVDPRLIAEEEEVNDITPVIEPFYATVPEVDKTENDEDSTFEEIEAFQVNTMEEEKAEEEIAPVDAATVVTPFIDEIYSGEVESILPDFEKLNAQSDEHEEHESFFTFDESKDLVVTENETTGNTDESDSNEAVSFETEALNEALFDNSFMQIFPGGKNLTELDNQEKEPVIKIPQPKMEVESILEKFMRENPSITRPKAEFFNPVNVAKLSIEEKDEIVSETLASIYLKQGLVKKAISTYEKLSLIYPHKIAYFAALIKQLKTEHNIN
ncbi:MAG: hypothetical protein V4538_14430 [Bacteroidota bacterium]